MTTMRVLVALTLTTLLAAACSSAPAEDGPVQIAMLRAVPSSPTLEPGVTAELRRAGFERGRTLRIVTGEDEVHPDPEDARTAVERWARSGVDAVLAMSTTGARAAMEADTELPVVFLVNDPVAAGLVEDPERPGGRATGVTFRVPADRTLALIQRVFGDVDRIGLAYPDGDPAAVPHRDATARAAEELELVLEAEPYADGRVVEAVQALAARGVDVLLFSNSPTAFRDTEGFRQTAIAADLPWVANGSTAPGAVFTLSPDPRAVATQLGRQLALVLNGVDPGTIPVADPSRFTLEVDRSAAEVFGVEVPEDVMREANVVR